MLKFMLAYVLLWTIMKIRLKIKIPAAFQFNVNNINNQTSSVCVYLRNINNTFIRWFSYDEYIYSRIFINTCNIMDYYEN